MTTLAPSPVSAAAALDAAQRGSLREVLLARRQALLDSLALHTGGESRAQHARELLQQDSDDAREHAADREVDLAFTDQERLELASIGQALQRLESGDYGQCVDCGEAIALERLKVQPQALRCIGCAGEREARSGGVGAATL